MLLIPTSEHPGTSEHEARCGSQQACTSLYQPHIAWQASRTLPRPLPRCVPITLPPNAPSLLGLLPLPKLAVSLSRLNSPRRHTRNFDSQKRCSPIAFPIAYLFPLFLLLLAPPSPPPPPPPPLHFSAIVYTGPLHYSPPDFLFASFYASVLLETGSSLTLKVKDQ
ncbi:hypothetical protein E2C01_028076 [Portunus trituberculatus]|uniref:Uncharacterized protein n=1 Tax=Portunus trituberculatus TaxID=210409 RepID=A0A5B7EN29_PORTR|nr:hypothetical protein [Portunus trituberculatus]